MTEPNRDLIPTIVAAAIAAAGPRGSNEAAWKAKINDAIPHIASMMNPPRADGSGGSRQWRIAEEVMTAAVFTATYVDHHVEESSTRALVRIDTGRPTKNYPDGIEPIRTHRTDNAQGRAMKARLDQLHPGDEMVIWKSIEASDDGTEKYRVLVHFETRPKRQERSQQASDPAGEQRGTDRAEERNAPEPARQPLTDAIDSDRLNLWREGAIAHLGMQGTADLRSRLRARGYDFDGVSEVEWDEIVRPIIREMLDDLDRAVTTAQGGTE
jgi:hypothetical protein